MRANVLGGRRGWVVGIAVAVVAVIAARAALPAVVKAYANSQLESLGEYSGHVADVDVSLLRGAYTLRDLVIVKRGADNEAPFADVPVMDISLDWGALFRGELVGEIEAGSPALNLVQARSTKNTQLGTGVNWPEEVRRLFPFRFNRVEMTGGVIAFRAPGIEAGESLTLRETHLLLQNLTNVRESDEETFAELALSGRVMGNAPLSLAGRINPNRELPTFDVDFSLEDARLADVTPWLDAFLNVDAEGGTFSMYSELAAAEGRFAGYVKPIMENAQVFRSGEETEGPFRKAWEALVDFALNVFENRERDQVATQIPLSGELENPEAGILEALVNLLRNAFVAGFSHSLEGAITLRDVAGADAGDGNDESDDDE